jgi:hypothetical protein
MPDVDLERNRRESEAMKRVVVFVENLLYSEVGMAGWCGLRFKSTIQIRGTETPDQMN